MYRNIAVYLILCGALLVSSCSKDDSPTGYIIAPPDTLWTNTFFVGTSEGVVQTNDGGYVLVSTTGYGTTQSVLHLLKADANGDSIWCQSYDEIHQPMGHGILSPSDGGFIVVGQSQPYVNLSDIFLLKTDSNGSVQWHKTFGDSAGEQGYDIKETADGGYIVVALRSVYYNPAYNVNEFSTWLLKTDGNGDSLWCRNYVDYYGMSVLVCPDGGYIIGGYILAENSDFWLMKTDMDGNVLWDHIYDINNRDIGLCIQHTSDGGYTLCGYTGNSIDEVDYCLLKTNSQGDKLWHRTYSENIANVAVKVRQTSDDGFIMVGHAGSSFTSFSNDIFILKANSFGIEQWRQVFDTGSNEMAFDVQQTSDEGYIVTGNIWSLTWLIRFDSEN